MLLAFFVTAVLGLTIAFPIVVVQKNNRISELEGMSYRGCDPAVDFPCIPESRVAAATLAPDLLKITENMLDKQAALRSQVNAWLQAVQNSDFGLDLSSITATAESVVFARPGSAIQVPDIDSFLPSFKWLYAPLAMKTIVPSQLTVDETINVVSGCFQLTIVQGMDFATFLAQTGNQYLSWSDPASFAAFFSGTMRRYGAAADRLLGGALGAPSEFRQLEVQYIRKMATHYERFFSNTTGWSHTMGASWWATYNPQPPKFWHYKGQDQDYTTPNLPFMSYDSQLGANPATIVWNQTYRLDVVTSLKVAQAWTWTTDQLARQVAEMRAELADLPELGVPPVLYGRGGTAAGPGIADAFAAILDRPDEDGNIVQSSVVALSSNTRTVRANTRASFDRMFSLQPASVRADVPRMNQCRATVHPKVPTEVRDAVCDQVATVYERDFYPTLQQLNVLQQQMTFTNGKRFYDDSYPSLWRQYVPGRLQAVNRGADGFATSFDFNMTDVGVSAATVSRVVAEGGVLLPNGFVRVPIGHTRIAKMSTLYRNNLQAVVNIVPGSKFVSMGRVDPTKTWREYTSYADILKNVKAVVTDVISDTDIEDQIVASGYSLRYFFDDFKKVLCDRWIATQPSFFTPFASLSCGSSCRFSDAPGATEDAKLQWFGGLANQLAVNRTVPDYVALGYHYGWEPYTWANASLYWPFGALVPAPAVVAAQRAANGRLVYDAASPFTYIFRQHYQIAADGTPIVPFRTDSAAWNAWAKVDLTGATQGTYYAFKYRDFVLKLWQYIWSSPRITTVFPQWFVDTFVTDGTGNPFRWFTSEVYDSPTGSLSNGATSTVLNGVLTFSNRLNLPSTTPKSVVEDQQVLFHEIFFGHGLEQLVKAVSELKNIKPAFPWLLYRVSSPDSLLGFFTPSGTSNGAEGWATYGEYNSLVKGFYCSYSITGVLTPDVLDYPSYLLSLLQSSRLAARQVVDVGVNSARYAWSLGKAFNVFNQISGVTGSGLRGFIARHYTFEAQQITYALGLSINFGLRNQIAGALGEANFNEPAFNAWRVFNTSVVVDAALFDIAARPDTYEKFRRSVP